MDLLLFGIQGSGKGTQAKKLAAEFGYTIFEAGGALRAMAASGTELGNTVKSFVDKGSLVPSEIILDVVRAFILAAPSDQKILFDGIPRDMDQMRGFDMMMKEAGREFRCIHLMLPEDITIQRIQARAAEQGRIDDANIEFIQRRIGWFKEKNIPVIEEYKKKGMVTEIDGLGSVEEVYERMREAVLHSA